jgi:PAS domain S-box-containing protein
VGVEGVLLQIARSTPSGLLVLDPSSTITFVNRAMEGMLGLSQAEVEGLRVSNVLTGWTSDDEVTFQRCLAGETRSTSLRLLSSPGRPRDAMFAPFHGDDGAVAGVFITVRALSPERAEEETTADPRFRIMADASPVLLWMAGKDGHCTFFNQPWLEFTGRTMEMELGVGWAEGVHAEDFQRCMSTFMTAFVARREFQMEYRLRRADGEYRWLLDTGIPHYAADGEFAGFIGSCIDVTELKNVRDTLDRTVRERTAELESFAYSVSHDLRSPLRAIEGFGRELLEQYGAGLDDRAQHYLTRICTATHRMSDLIDGLLALSRITRADLVRTHVDLSALARSILDDLREREPERNVDVRVADGLAAFVEPRLTRALLENLLANAWKFTSRRERASIEVGRSGEGAAFFVRDDGAGFDMEHAGRLFAPFHRLHPPQQFEGTGIGLATVQRVVARHGGRVWAEAAVEKGATFFFTFEGAR